MKKTIPIFVILLLAMLWGVVGDTAPYNVNFIKLNDGMTYYAGDLVYKDFITILDNDTTFLNCTVFIDYIDVDDKTVYLDIPIEEYTNIINNTRTPVEIEFAYYQEYNDIQSYNVTLSCTNGVGITNSTEKELIMRTMFIYDESDISKAIIDVIVSMLAIMSVLIVGFFALLMFAFFLKISKKR